MKKTHLILLFLGILSFQAMAQEGSRLGVLLGYEGDSFLLARKGVLKEYFFDTDLTGLEFLEGDFISTLDDASLMIQLEGTYKILQVYENTSFTMYTNPVNNEADINMIYGKVDVEIADAGDTRIGDFDIATSDGPATVEYKIVVDPESGVTKTALSAKKGSVDITSVATGEESDLSQGEGTLELSQAERDVSSVLKPQNQPSEEEPITKEDPQEDLAQGEQGDLEEDPSESEPGDSGPGLLTKFKLELGGEMMTILPDLGTSEEASFLEMFVAALYLRAGGLVHLAYKPVNFWGIGIETGYLSSSVLASDDTTQVGENFTIPFVLTMPMNLGPLFIQPAAGLDIWGYSLEGTTDFTLYGAAYVKGGLKFSLFTLYASYGITTDLDKITTLDSYITRVSVGGYIPVGKLFGL